MPRVATTVWTISPELVLALDEHLGPPVDSYVNGSQTWLVEDGPITLEWRLHPVAGYRAPAGVSTYDLWEGVVAQLSSAGDPHALRLGDEVRPLTAIWDGLECYAAYGDELEPQQLAAAATAQLGRPPDRFGLVDHEAIGDAWEQRERRGLDRRAAARPARRARRRRVVSPRQGGSRGSSYQAGELLAVDRAEREVEPAVRAGERLRQRVAREEPDRRRLERMALQLAADHAAVEHDRVHRHAREAEAQPVEHRDQRTGSHSMPVSSSTSFIAISDARVADVGPADRVQPPTGVGALGEQDLLALVARRPPRPRPSA